MTGTVTVSPLPTESLGLPLGINGSAGAVQNAAGKF